MIRSSSCSSLKRSIGTQQDAGENLKESSTGAPHVEVEEPSRRCESAVPGPSKKRRKRTPEWQVCQEFEGLGKKKKTKKKKRVSDMPRAQFSTLARKRLENVLITLKLTSAFEMQIKFLEYMISNVSWAQKLLFVLFRRSSASRRPVRTIAIIPKILGAENGRSPDTSPD